MLRTLVVFGTRPEAIKMAPVVLELQSRAGIETKLCVTGQHREMLDEALAVFGLTPDFDLDIMRPGQTLADTTSSVLSRLSPILAEQKSHVMLVHGDTTTTFATGLAGFYQGVPVGHVEAGLRTGNLHAPWPEEFNRRSVDMFAELLWAPTEAAAKVLRAEGRAEADVLITGNTVLDALRLITTRIRADASLRQSLAKGRPALTPGKRLLLVTGHRRESFNGGLASVCRALNRLAERDDVEVVWSLHPNPQVTSSVRAELHARPNVHLVPPFDYLTFVGLMMEAHLIITDSGGIQEEAPSLSKPVLVTRNETERPEAVHAGTAQLVGTDTDRIVQAATRLLDDPAAYAAMADRPNPFGDSYAARRIVDSIVARFQPRNR